MAAVDAANSERIAADLLNEFRTLPAIWAQSGEALSRMLPASPAVAALIVGARDALAEGQRGDLRLRAIDPFDPALRRYLIDSMGSLPEERLRILFLDAAGRLLADEELQRGSLTQMAIYPRTIFRRALEHNAAGLVLVHNHPSGDERPSSEDIAATQKLDQVGRALDVPIVDHIIVTSHRAHHLMSSDVRASAGAHSAGLTLRSCEPAEDLMDQPEILANARTSARRRLLRRQLVGSPELFGEPAWEMLLDLFIHECEAKPIDMSSLSASAGIPTSSGLKLIQRLCDAGIMSRVPDVFDGRRSLMKIDPDIAHRLRAYFAAGSE